MKLGRFAHVGAPPAPATGTAVGAAVLVHELAPVVAVYELLKNPHEKCPELAFDLLMRTKTKVEQLEAHVVVYDLQPVRDAAHAAGRPLELDVLFHPWLFPQLEYRQQDQVDIEACVLECQGVAPSLDRTVAAAHARHQACTAKVTVRDQVFMAMDAGRCRIRVDPLEPLAQFWSVCAPANSDIALVTKHVLLCETVTSITRSLKQAYDVLQPVTAQAVLKHLEAVLVASEEAQRRLSRLMARCASAFEGVVLDLDGKRYDGPTEPHECWDEQLRVLCRTVDVRAHGPLLSDMIRGKVMQEVAKELKQELTEDGWTSAPAWAKARAIHKVLTELIHRVEQLAEQQAELLAARAF